MYSGRPSSGDCFKTRGVPGEILLGYNSSNTVRTMSLVRINGLSKSFGMQTVLKPISLDIPSGKHIGLVGRNGIGKTTLLKLIARLETPTDGHVASLPGTRIGYLAQDPLYQEGRSLTQEVREGIAAVEKLEEELRDLEAQLADPALKENEEACNFLLNRYARVQELYEHRDGWRADARVEAVLDGLKVPRNDWERDVSTFSGGERNIIGLARLLVQNPDLMLLDEPGNHLDFEGLDWLEDVLRNSASAFILVSHNRYLLDSVCETIWELESQTIEEYAGNYSSYRAEKLTRIEKAESLQRRQEKEAERLRFQIQRLKSWASVYDNPKLARTAKRFEARIENMQKVDIPREDKRKIGVHFQSAETKGNIALDVKEYTKTYDDSPPMFRNSTFRIRQGECVALVGANGTGKTTLFKDIVANGRWENETLRVGRAMKIGYFAQMGEMLEPKSSLVNEMLRLSGLLRNESEKLLHRFLFTRDDLDKPVAVLSGGEKARLQLAALMARGSNFLLLDEPTNHLDIQSREAVEDALEEFPGTLFIISHDRYFIDKIADRILFLEPPNVSEFDGNFSDFFYTWKERQLQRTEAEEQEKREAKKAKRAAKVKKKPKWDRTRFEWLESEIERLEGEREKVSAEIEKEQSKGNRKRLQARQARLDDIETQLEDIWEEWVMMGEGRKKI